MIATVLELHPTDVVAQSVLACEFRGVHEVVDLLVLVEVLIDVLPLLRGGTGPQDVPIVLISLNKAMAFQNQSHKLCLCLKSPKSQRVRLVVAPYLRQQLELDISYVGILGCDLEARESLARKPDILAVSLADTRCHLDLSACALILKEARRSVRGRWSYCRPLEETTTEVLFVFILLM